MKQTKTITFTGVLGILAVLGLETSSLASEGPCDIYKAAGTPCVAAHSMTRALFGSYTGNLYQVRRKSDGAVKDIPVEKAGGYVNASVQDEFCSGTTCTVSVIYDQTSYRNDLKKSPKTTFIDVGVEADANKVTITIAGHKAHGIYTSPWSKIAYRNNETKGVATGDEAEDMYMVVDGKHYNDKCCYDYGNAETNGKDNGKGTMEAVYFGSDTEWGGPGQGSGPWVAADLEDGVFKGDDAGWMWGKTHTTPWPTAYSIIGNFATAMLKGRNDGTFALKGANAQTDSLITVWDGKRKTGYSPRKLEGAIILGCGGDGSPGGEGTFFEGVMTKGSASNTVDKLIQANIAAAGYGSSVDLSDTVPVEPYKTTLQIPGKIEAEDYDKGGNGRGFYDTDISNESSLYRADNAGLDTAGGATVYGWVTEGDWLRYTVEVPGSEKMTVSARVASAGDNANFSLLLDEKEIANFNVPNTGDWKTFKEVTDTLDGISEGKHVLKLKVGKPYFNVDWIEFSPVSTQRIAMEQRFSAGQEHYRIFNLLGVKISAGNDLTALKRSLPSGVYLVKNTTSGEITKIGIAHKIK